LLYNFINNADQFKLVVNEIGFPFKWLDSEDKLMNVDLPESEHFINLFTGEPFCDGVYGHSLITYEEFKCANIRDYLRLFTTVSVYLLADICTTFNDYAKRHFELIPFHCNTLHTYNFHAFTNSLGDNTFQNIATKEIYDFSNRAVSGGLIQSNVRFSNAMNLDIVSSYGSSALKPLAFRDFKFLSKQEMKYFNIYSMDNDNKKGYLVEVSLSQPSHIHDELNSFPIVFNKRKINFDELSEEQKQMYKMIYPEANELQTPEMLILDLKDK
jgi:hypothetical protein